MSQLYFVHPTAIVDDGAQIGENSSIWHFSHIYSDVTIGKGCSFGQNTMVANKVVIGDNVKIQNNVALYSGVIVESNLFLGPSAVFTNVLNPRSQINRKGFYEKTLVRRGATIGANATIVCGITLGRYCFIAAGAVVTKNVPDYGLMTGVPARQNGWMTRHGHHIPATLLPGQSHKCPESGLNYTLGEDGKLNELTLKKNKNCPPICPMVQVTTKTTNICKGGSQTHPCDHQCENF